MVPAAAQRTRTSHLACCRSCDCVSGSNSTLGRVCGAEKVAALVLRSEPEWVMVAFFSCLADFEYPSAAPTMNLSEFAVLLRLSPKPVRRPAYQLEQSQVGVSTATSGAGARATTGGSAALTHSAWKDSLSIYLASREKRLARHQSKNA